MIDAVEDVKEAELDEPERRLMPARIEPHEARIAVNSKARSAPPGGRNRMHDVDAHAQARQLRTRSRTSTDRTESGTRTATSSSPCFQKSSVSARQPRAGQRAPAPRRRTSNERSAGSETRTATSSGHSRRTSSSYSLRSSAIQSCRRVPKQAAPARESPADPLLALRQVHVAHRHERRADQQAQALAFRLQERLNRDVVRDLVRRGRGAPHRASSAASAATPRDQCLMAEAKAF